MYYQKIFLPPRCTSCTVFKIVSSTLIIECSYRTWLRVTRPRRTVVTNFANSGCLWSYGTVITNNTLFTILHKPPSCLIKKSSLGTGFLYWTIGANTQAWDSICDVCWTIEASATVACLSGGLFKAILSSSAHCTVIYTLSISVWVECTNWTRDFYSVT